VEAETKLKTEVTRIKKKLQIQITELEMSLDVANKNNIELQKTIKKQSLTLTVSRGTHIIHSKYVCSLLSEVYLITHDSI
jgi:LPS O-antigen subunit length determinant protein (WzzB/FepE family)